MSCTVSIKTGTDTGAGTDGHVYLSMYGRTALGQSRSSEKVHLPGSYENSNTDTNTRDFAYMAHVGSLTIHHHGDGSSSSEWTFNSLEVKQQEILLVETNAG